MRSFVQLHRFLSKFEIKNLPFFHVGVYLSLVGGLVGCASSPSNRISSLAPRPTEDHMAIVFLALDQICTYPGVMLSKRQGDERQRVKGSVDDFFSGIRKSWGSYEGKANVARFELSPGEYQIDKVLCFERDAASAFSVIARPNSSDGILAFKVNNREVVNLGLIRGRATSNEFVPVENGEEEARKILGSRSRSKIVAWQSVAVLVTPMGKEEIEAIQAKYPDEAKRTVYRPAYKEKAKLSDGDKLHTPLSR